MRDYRLKPDDRRDNVEKLQDMVENTLENIEEAEETMRFADQDDQAAIEAKNERRRESLKAMRVEIKDEADAQEDQLH